MASKRQTILDALVASILPAITTGNGYTNTVSLVMRGQRNIDDLADSDFPVLFIGSTEETRQNISKTTFKSELLVNLIGAVKSPDGVSGAQAAMDSFIADVSKCLLADHLQSGIANYTEIRRITTDHGDRDLHALFVMEVYFRYTTEGNAP